MAIKYVDHFANLSAWTLVQTQGTITSSSGTMLFSVKSGGDGDPTNLQASIVPALPTIADGDYFFIQYKGNGSANDCVQSIQISAASASLDVTQSYNSWRSGRNQDRADGFYSTSAYGNYTFSSPGNNGAQINVWHDFRVQWNVAAGTTQSSFDYRATPAGTEGALDPYNAAAWTNVTTTGHPIHADIVAQAPFIVIGKDSVLGTVNIDEFYITDVNLFTPQTPSSLSKGTITTSAPNHTSIPFSWTNNGNAMSQDGFNLYIALDGGSYSLAHQIVGGTATSYTYTAATQGHHYQFKILSYVVPNGTVYESAASNVLTFDTPTDPPTNLVAVEISPSEIDLSWDSTTDGWEDGFSVERSIDNVIFAEIGTTSSAETTYQDMTVVAGITYYYRVRSFWDLAHPPTIYSAYTNTATITDIGGDDAGADALLLEMLT